MHRKIWSDTNASVQNLVLTTKVNCWILLVWRQKIQLRTHAEVGGETSTGFYSYSRFTGEPQTPCNEEIDLGEEDDPTSEHTPPGS